MNYKQRQVENLIRRIVKEQEQENELTAIFKDEGYSNVPDACKSKTGSDGVVTTDVKGCFEEFQKANQQVMDIAAALKTLMDEKGIQAESRRFRRRF